MRSGGGVTRGTAIVFCVCMAACGPRPADETALSNSLTDEDIRRVATAELLRLEWRPEDYRAHIVQDKEGWRVEFEPTEPAPPGSDLVVFIDRDGVVVDVMQGE